MKCEGVNDRLVGRLRQDAAAAPILGDRLGNLLSEAADQLERREQSIVCPQCLAMRETLKEFAKYLEDQGAIKPFIAAKMLDIAAQPCGTVAFQRKEND